MKNALRERLAEQSKAAGETSTTARQDKATSAPGVRLLVHEENDPSVGGVQRPRVFYRRERESQPLIVARP